MNSSQICDRIASMISGRNNSSLRLVSRSLRARQPEPELFSTRIHMLLPQKLIVRQQHVAYVLTMSEIIYCQAESNYCRIYSTNDVVVLASSSLKDIENKLQVSSSFFRIHQSFLINLDELRRVTRTNVELNNNITLPLSRSKRKALFHLLNL